MHYASTAYAFGIDYKLCEVHSFGMQAESPIDLKAIRDRLGESQDEFGRRFGVDQGTISRWETSGIPKRGAARSLIERVVADIPQPEPVQ
jgi:DNA-binding transcriptional regulator YiaG